LLSQGASPNVDLGINENEDNDPAIAAVKYGHLKVLKCLFRHHQHQQQQQQQQQQGRQKPWARDIRVSLAAKHNHLKILKYLIKHKGNPKAHQYQPLKEAAQGGHLRIFRFLIAQGCNPFKYNKTLIRLAATHDRLNIIKYIDDQWAMIAGNMGQTALYYAITSNSLRVTRFLIVPANNYQLKLGALKSEAFREVGSRGYLQILKLLVKHRYINLRDDGYWVLAGAARNHYRYNLRVIRFLFRQGVKPYLRQDDLDYLVENSDDRYALIILRYLIFQGLEITYRRLQSDPDLFDIWSRRARRSRYLMAWTLLSG
jgi:hypothetical protein